MYKRRYFKSERQQNIHNSIYRKDGTYRKTFNPALAIRDINRVYAQGRIAAKDEVTRVTPNGTVYLGFWLAVPRSDKDKSEGKYHVVRCYVFGENADLVFDKYEIGMPIFVEGELRCEKYGGNPKIAVREIYDPIFSDPEHEKDYEDEKKLFAIVYDKDGNARLARN